MTYLTRVTRQLYHSPRPYITRSEAPFAFHGLGHFSSRGVSIETETAGNEERGPTP